MFEIFVYENQNGNGVDIGASTDVGHPDKSKTCIFVLEPTRLRANDYRETLKIEIKKADNTGTSYNGEIYCDVLQLERDLVQLRSYGTGFNRKDITRIRQKLDDNYRKIAQVDDNRTTLETDVLNIVRLYCEYIVNEEIEVVDIKGETLYNIPVMDFRNVLKTSAYKKYTYSEVKRILRDLDYTYCATGRTDNTVSVENKETKEKNNRKVISFRAEEPDVAEIIESLMSANK